MNRVKSGQELEKMVHLWRCWKRGFDLAERDYRAQIPQRERSVGGREGGGCCPSSAGQPPHTANDCCC